MEIAFETQGVRSLCISDPTMRRRFGPESAALIKSVLADIRAAQSILEVTDHKLQPLGPNGERLELVFDNNLVLVILANQRKITRKEDGSVDWNFVKRIKIIDLVLES